MSDSNTLPPTPGELDRMGSTLWSRWNSSRTGNILIVVNRCIPTDGSGFYVQILDVDNEKVADVAAVDWKRWVQEKKVTRKR